MQAILKIQNKCFHDSFFYNDCYGSCMLKEGGWGEGLRIVRTIRCAFTAQSTHKI